MKRRIFQPLPKTSCPPGLRQLLTRKVAAKLLGISVRTLDRWAEEGFGPPRLPAIPGWRGPRYELHSLCNSPDDEASEGDEHTPASKKH